MSQTITSQRGFPGRAEDHQWLSACLNQAKLLQQLVSWYMLQVPWKSKTILKIVDLGFMVQILIVKQWLLNKGREINGRFDF